MEIPFYRVEQKTTGHFFSKNYIKFHFSLKVVHISFNKSDYINNDKLLLI